MNVPAVHANPQKMIAISKEAGQLEPVVEKYRQYLKAEQEAQDLRQMLNDPEMRDLAESELPGVVASAAALLEDLRDEFLAAEDNAIDSFFLEIRAGTGGEEAALFGRDLYEMYRKYCEAKRWRFDVSDFSPSERGGFKEALVK